MAHNVTLNSGSGGDTLTTVDLSLNSYPTTGEVPASCLYVSPDINTAPTPVTDSNPLPVDGTVTANAGTGTFTISGAVTNTVLSVVGNGTAATAQRVTLANDSTGIVALTTSTASIGKLASNTGVTIGAVEIASAQTLGTVTTVGTVTNLSQMGGAAIAMGTGVRTAGTQRVTIATDDSVPVTGTFWQATQPVSGTVAATQSGTWNVGTVTTVSTVTNLSQLGGAAVPIGAGLEATAVRVTLPTDGTGKVNAAQSGTWTVGLSAAQTLDTVTTVGTVTTVSTVTNLSQMGGVAIAMGTGTRSAGTQRVTIATDDVVPASQSGTWTVGLSAAQTLATVTTVGTVSTLTGSGVAHDSADSGNPHKIGARAVTSVSAQTLVAANDRTDLLAGLDGLLITRPHCNLEDIVTGTPVAITDGSSTSVLASPGAGLRNYITSISISNSSASFVTVDIRDGTAGAVLWTFPVPATGGVVYTFPVPLKFSVATAVAADPSAAASTITVSVLGFKSKV